MSGAKQETKTAELAITFQATDKEASKRGWIFDELMKIGHLEADLCHHDENICNDYTDMDNNKGDLETITKLGDDIATRHEIMEIEYENRAMCLDNLFEIIPGSDRHWLCDVKHAATAFVIAAETYHASGFNPTTETSLVKCGKALAMTCSRAFGMNVMDCLRCLNDSLNSKMGFDKPGTFFQELSSNPVDFDGVKEPAN